MANETGQRETSKDETTESDVEVKAGTPIEDLEHRLQDAEGLDEDLAMIVARNWQSLLGGLVLVLIAVWVFGQYQTSKQATVADASVKLSELQDAYPDVVLSKVINSDGSADDAASKSAEEVSKLQAKAFSETINNLRDKFDGTFYAKLAPIYESQLLIANKEYENAYNELEKLGLGIIKQDSWPKGEREIGETEIVEELAALLYLRAKVQDPAVPRAETRKSVGFLVERGSFSAVEAALLLYRTAENDDERSKSIELARTLRKERPFLATALESAFEEAGAKL